MSEPHLWQRVVLDLLRHPPNADLRDRMRQVMSPGAFNKDFGLYLNMGRQMGHTTLAGTILEQFPEAIVVAPNERMRNLLEKKLEDPGGRVVLARFPETQMKFNIVNKAEPPYDQAEICVVDGASLLTEWELAPMRCASWKFYIELQ